MSVTAIDVDRQDQQTLQYYSDEDVEFNRVYLDIQGSDATETIARVIFDAGVNFVRDSEKVDSLVDKSGAHHLIVVNPQIVPAWMFRDAMLTYMQRLHEEFTAKHSNGDMNTKNLFECIKSLEHVLEVAIPVDTAKQTVADTLAKTKKKCETILNDTI